MEQSESQQGIFHLERTLGFDVVSTQPTALFLGSHAQAEPGHEKNPSLVSLFSSRLTPVRAAGVFQTWRQWVDRLSSSLRH